VAWRGAALERTLNPPKFALSCAWQNRVCSRRLPRITRRPVILSAVQKTKQRGTEREVASGSSRWPNKSYRPTGTGRLFLRIPGSELPGYVH
jgi:hypothetical protein